MGNDELSRYVETLGAWIAMNEAFADDLAEMAADLRRDGRDRTAQNILTCSRNFRIRALELRGQLAEARVDQHLGRD